MLIYLQWSKGMFFNLLNTYCNALQIRSWLMITFNSHVSLVDWGWVCLDDGFLCSLILKSCNRSWSCGYWQRCIHYQILEILFYSLLFLLAMFHSFIIIHTAFSVTNFVDLDTLICMPSLVQSGKTCIWHHDRNPPNGFLCGFTLFAHKLRLSCAL